MTAAAAGARARRKPRRPDNLETRLTDEQRDQVARMTPAMWWVLNRMQAKKLVQPWQFDAAYDAAVKALFYAVETHDPARHASLKTWVIYVVRWRAKRAVDALKFAQLRGRFAYSPDDDVVMNNVYDPRVRPDAEVETAEATGRLEELVGQVPDNVATAVRMRADGALLDDIAAALGVTRQRAQQVLADAKKWQVFRRYMKQTRGYAPALAEEPTP